MTTLLSLPTELISHVLLFIPIPWTLLSLSLTCHRLHALVLPSLLHRLICLAESDASVFSDLAENKRLAREVRGLAVNDTGEKERSEFWKVEFGPRLGEEERALAGYRSAWTLLDTEKARQENTRRVREILPAVGKGCVNLEELRLKVGELRPWTGFLRGFYGDEGWGAEERELKFVEVVEEPGEEAWALEDAVELLEMFGGLEAFAWASATIVQASQLIRYITQLTSHCPTLHSLSIYVFSTINPIPSALPLFTARLPCLRSLDLGHIQSTPLMVPFLEAHPLLEHVSIQCAGHAEISLPENALPRVQTFDIVWLTSAQLYTQVCIPLPSGELRPLQALSITAGAFRDENTIEDLCEALRGHKRIKGLRWEDTSMQLSHRLGQVGQACPTIEKLSILAFYLDQRLPEIAAALSHFPSLKKILIGRGRLDLEHCAQLHESCPSLRQIGPWERVDVPPSEGRSGGLRWRHMGGQGWGLPRGP
ncbi:hypothetical protein DACRYDRAFT_110162 [Dacryopinax primogenitus]|uniref:F-box domain-containing protein n=1 Tax=Dacryopinax primogenitus (strain DJM 731) TaxID=1858805 RepID=M5FQZ0_DACPD|nr:uncharacterized protein DACRYDRAFT_110162 [Dacryopinax primogenitus]EJT99440.1 hypothetical protein DACRYDRAFT_110162 [Dacryopinax primogenitus]